jgi:hypothetical protein
MNQSGPSILTAAMIAQEKKCNIFAYTAILNRFGIIK